MRGIIDRVRERIEAIAAELGVPLDAAAVDRLMILRGLWLAQGRAINLTGAGSDDALIHHVGDGLATIACARRLATQALDETARWLDVGSGGGFPALVVAAATSVRLVLVEPRQRRAAFLEFALASIGNNSEVIRARIGDATWSEYAVRSGIAVDTSPFSVTSSRAVFAPEDWLEIGDKLVMHGGFVVVHLRPEQGVVGTREPNVLVDWQRSRVAGFRRG
jgi:16S rRNA (guanine527-N7)-methyltransferase